MNKYKTKHFNILFIDAPDVLLISVTSQWLSIINTSDIKSIVADMINRHNPKRVVFDLYTLEGIDSTILGFFIHVYKLCKDKDCEIYLTNKNPKVNEILLLSGTAHLFKEL